MGGERVLLAAKTAGAAALAWLLGHQLPGALGDYAYYAPFGAVIAMTPTLVSSARSTLHTVAGTAVGIGLAWLLFLLHAPGWLAVPIAAAVGVIVAGLFTPGPARDYVPVAALFVLTVGGADAGDYSMGYLLQVALGMGIAVIVTLLIPPPVGLTDAADSARRLRAEVAAVLRDVATTVEEPDADEPAATAAIPRLRRALASAEESLDQAQESRRGNARAWRQREAIAAETRQHGALRRIVRRAEELIDLLAPAQSDDESLRDLPDGARAESAAAIRLTADAVEQWPEAGPDAELAHGRIDEQLERMRAALEPGDRGAQVGGAVATLLGRIAVGATRPAD
ncbi:hypothetical protein GCM10027515_04300 [Schumannella luteola]|uniref:Uncharacterized membrane protein YgaE (UPF0421/DUF939 family) n=1 Tax=Schumannella luteola TaxID=472059 RepID=A0A852YAW9_9MICO|nr:FUSC family protein [Schumannella luteola]NYG98434.1 uncharacterized membrane protein YgaE (UPF0421/DUF939 family) [Schumannella luteola]TPX01333.1 hypothetical protein FJ656_28520 [Schumannella luteola]